MTLVGTCVGYVVKNKKHLRAMRSLTMKYPYPQVTYSVKVAILYGPKKLCSITPPLPDPTLKVVLGGKYTGHVS
jgi:hypothetical protein